MGRLLGCRFVIGSKCLFRQVPYIMAPIMMSAGSKPAKTIKTRNQNSLTNQLAGRAILQPTISAEAIENDKLRTKPRFQLHIGVYLGTMT